MTTFLYLKALHIIFICTWFAGLFYIVRLFIYYTEARDRKLVEKEILQKQLGLMMTRLWNIITVPSAVLTLILGLSVWHYYGNTPNWLWVKLAFVLGLYAYHMYLGRILKQLLRDEYRWSSQQLRVWNEGATLFLFAIVFLVVVKNLLSPLWGILGIIAMGILLMIGIKIYKRFRKQS
jgi:putative membrane protein